METFGIINSNSELNWNWSKSNSRILFSKSVNIIAVWTKFDELAEKKNDKLQNFKTVPRSDKKIDLKSEKYRIEN